MESDFVTRHHLDSVTRYSDPGIADLLHKYRTAPADPKPLPNLSNLAGFAQPEAASSSNVYISNMLGQLQGSIQSMMNKEPSTLAGTGSGLQLNVNSDILRWMIVLIFALALVMVMFQYMSYRRRTKNPLKGRLRRLEKEIRKLRSRKNPAELADSGVDSDSDEDEDLDD